MDNIYTIYKDHPAYQKLIASGPKRILSIEGNKGHEVIILNFLQSIEDTLIARYNDPKFVLSDYFDLVGSQGSAAIIATFIALGRSISYINKIYVEQEDISLESKINNHPDLLNLTIGSERFKTGLAIINQNFIASEAFIIHNHPSNHNYEIIKGISILDLLKITSFGKTSKDSKMHNLADSASDVFHNGVSSNLSMILLNLTTNDDGYGWRDSKNHLMMISIGNDMNHSQPSSLHYYNFNMYSDQSNIETSPIDLSKELPSTFDFGIEQSTIIPISQEKLMNLFSSVFRSEGKVYRKCKRVFARRAKADLRLATITSDGIETINNATFGDYIVKNQTATAEQYILKRENFEKKYTEIRKMPDGVWTEYQPIGKVIGVQLTEDLLKKLGLEKHFNIMASWGQAQYITIGDILVKPVDNEEYYRIGLKEFYQTYELMT